MSTRIPFPSASPVPVPLEEDNTPLPVRIPLGRRPPPPPLVEGKLISLKSGGVLALNSLAKLRLLRIDDLGDDNRWLLGPALPHGGGPAPERLPTPVERPELLAEPLPVDAPVLEQASVAMTPKGPRPSFCWQRLPPSSGSLQELSAVQLVGWAIATGYSGCLWMSPRADCSKSEPAGRELFFDAGVLIGARSQLPCDDLVELQGELWTQAQKKRAVEVLRKSRSEGLRRQLDLLVTAKLLDTKDFCQRQSDYVVELVCRALTPSSAPPYGTFRLLSTELPMGEQTMLPLAPRLLLTLAVRRVCGLALLQKEVGPLSTVLVPTSLALPQSGGAVLHNIGLSQPEEDALLRFDGERRLQEVGSSSGIGEHALYGLAYSLLSLGALVHPHNLSPDEQKRLESMQKARARARAMNEAMSVIQRKARLCEAADYFTLLGIDHRASLEEIRAAYQRERAAIAPATLPYRSRSAMDRELRQIAMVLDEAYAVLSDPVRRACYVPVSANR